MPLAIAFGLTECKGAKLMYFFAGDIKVCRRPKLLNFGDVIADDFGEPGEEGFFLVIHFQF